MPDLIYNVKFNIDDNLQEGVAGAERYEQQIEELQAEVAQLTNSLERAANQQNRFNKGAKGAGATLGRTNKQVAIGNQLFFSLSDGIQDSAQFSQGFSTGMRAIGNNIGFTAELMAVYIAQTAAMNAGTASFSTVMRGLGKQMMGVGGIILALNLAITALTVFTRRSKDAEKEVKSLGDTFVQASNDISGSVFGENSYLLTQGVIAELGREFDVLSKSIEESRGFFKNISNTLINDFNIASQETIENSRLFGEAQQENAKTNKDSTEALKNLISVTAEKLDVDEKEAKAILETVSAETEEIRNKERMRKAIIALVPEARDYYEIQEDTSRILDEFSLGIITSTTELSNQREAVSFLIERYRTLYTEGNTELLPFLIELDKLLSDIDKTIRGTELAPAFEFPEDLIQPDDLFGVIALDASRLFRQIYEEQEATFVDFNQLRIDILEDAFRMTGEIIDNEVELHENAQQKMTEATARRHYEDMRLQQMAEVTRLDALQRLVSSVSNATQAIFGQSKAVAIAEATINTFLAMTKARSMYAPPIGGILAAAELASGIATIANISKTNIGSSSLAGDDSGSTTSAFGFKMNEIEGAQRFRSPMFSPTSGQGKMQPKVEVQVLADRKKLYYMVKQGEEEYRSIKA